MPADRARFQAAALAGAIAVLHVIGFGVLFFAVAPLHLELSDGGVFGIGMGVTAYALGARHAFDADHIGAIDNVTRKLLGEGRHPASVGFFFALGHSTVVVAAGVLIALGADGFSAAMFSESSSARRAAEVWGPAVAGVFLLAIGTANLSALVRRRTCESGDREVVIAPLARIFRRAMRAVTRPWQMFPLGLAFGLGLDTATEVALLALSGGAAAGGLPFYAVLCLPVLFAAGMTLFDTLNSVLMRAAYASAMENPSLRSRYDLGVTGVTVAAALSLGTISIASALGNATRSQEGQLTAIAGVDLGSAGFVLTALLVAIWATAVVSRRFGHTRSLASD